MAERLVVIGGDAGGMAAAAQARRQQQYLEIVAFEKGDYTSYAACGIPYLVAGDIDGPDALVARTPEQFRDNQRIDVRMRHEVVGLDTDRRRLEVRDHGRDRTFSFDFDLLHIATGARPIRPDLPGIDLPHIHGVQTITDGVHLLAHARAVKCKRVVIVGGGYIGLEMAEAFLRWGAQVTVIEAADQVMSTFDADMAAPIAAAMRRLGIDVRLGVMAQGFTPTTVETSAGDIPADFVVLGLGVVPNADLAADAGIRVGVRGAIRVDQRQQTSVEGIYAAGDCAESFHRVTRRQVHIALGTIANRQGRVAGINLGGGYATFPGVVGTAVTKICALEAARTGVNEVEAARAGFRYEAVTVDSTTTAGYFPTAEHLTIKLLAERGSRRVLGAQIVGAAGAAKRIDAIATAVTAEMTVDDVINLDLGYAPPFAPVWEAVQTAARRVAGSLDQSMPPVPGPGLAAPGTAPRRIDDDGPRP